MEHVTQDNLSERLKDQSFKDFLSSKPHPHPDMDDSSYTLLDYTLFKLHKYSKAPKKTIELLNGVIDGGDVPLRMKNS